MPPVKKPAAKASTAKSRQVRRAEQRAEAKAAEQTNPPPVIEPGEDGTIDAPPEGEPANGVLVHRIDDGQGGFQTRIQIVGDVRVTEIDTILALGRRGFRKDTGLDD